jgi:hypothetical protein
LKRERLLQFDGIKMHVWKHLDPGSDADQLLTR